MAIIITLDTKKFKKTFQKIAYVRKLGNQSASHRRAEIY
jgi:hypothetical protein